MVNNLPAKAGETVDVCGFDSWVRKLHLEKEMATYSSILAWIIP